MAGSLEGKVFPAEWQTRLDLAACFRVAYHFGWNDTIHNQLSARVPGEPDRFLMNPLGRAWHEFTASALIKTDFAGRDYTESDLRISGSGRNFHGAILQARPDLNCMLHVHAKAVVALSATRDGILPLGQLSSTMCGRVLYHDFAGLAVEVEEGRRIAEDLGGNLLMVMWNHSLLTAGRTIAEAFSAMHELVAVYENQVLVLSLNRPVTLIPEEVCRRTRDKMLERQKTQPAGELELAMYRRLAERLDPSFQI